MCQFAFTEMDARIGNVERAGYDGFVALTNVTDTTGFAIRQSGLMTVQAITHVTMVTYMCLPLFGTHLLIDTKEILTR